MPDENKTNGYCAIFICVSCSSFPFFCPVIESPDGLVAIEPSTIIAEHNSDVTFTCRTNSGPIGAHTFMWNDTFESSKTQ